MKTLVKLLLFLLIAASFTAWADKILINGRPIILVPETDHYSFPDSYTTFNHFHFVDISGDRRVCFLNQRPDLKPLDLIRVPIEQNNEIFLWYCYRYDPRFFTINF